MRPHIHYPLRPRHLTISTFSIFLLAGLVACGGNQGHNPVASSTGNSTQLTSTEITGTETSASSSSSTTTKANGVAKVKETFGSLAPAELFEKFESCMPNGVAGSSACSGPTVGQFQFFDNAAKAASTTQLLTELRSSKIVSDEGNRVVGWSTLGTMSIISVVDNQHGLVLQQMVSSDKQDPEQRIYDLGLAKKSNKTSSSSTSSATSSGTAVETTSNEPEKAS